MRKLETIAADSATLQAYLREIAKFPRLDAEQERQLGQRIQQLGDDQAIATLVEANLRFVVSYAKRYQHLGVPFLDLIHEGKVGLIEAARRFDPDRNVKFITYAVWWVRQAVMHLLSESARVYSLPTKVSGAAWAQAFMRLQADDVSLSDRVWVHGAGGEGVELADTLQDHAAHEIDDDLTRDALVQELETAMEELDPKERQVMRLRYGLHDDEPWTLQQVGDRMRLSRERIRQIETRAMQKLRRRKNLRSYLN